MARVLSTKNERISFLLGIAAAFSILLVFMAIRGGVLLFSSHSHTSTTFDLICEIVAILFFSLMVTVLVLTIIAFISEWVCNGKGDKPVEQPTKTATVKENAQFTSEPAPSAKTVTELLNEDLADGRSHTA